ncbi:MAG: tRNA-dihydrouridine synthase family protein [Lachnospiraceae bacterium]|nr:tRNA-dihydrouridine synthase family protein [Lachnospiraceae bacterium]
MRYYLAPMEGITNWVFRSAYHSCFRQMDKYFTPFLVPHVNKDFNTKEKNEIVPEHNQGQKLVPQILTKNAEDFVRTANILKEYGYQEVNLNLGCPSGTVVSKGRGAGFLEDPEELDRFFDAVFSELGMKISVKTRIGLHKPEKFEDLLEVYNRYPLEELIIHPRVRQDFYNNHPNMEVFEEACQKSVNPLCYNGDLCTVQNIREFQSRFPEIDAVMIGRGILKNPGLAGEADGLDRVDKDTLRRFHDEIYDTYRGIMSGDRNAIFKMKEFWSYLITIFENGEKSWKKIKKAQTAESYEAAVDEIFYSHRILWL